MIFLGSAIARKWPQFYSDFNETTVKPVSLNTPPLWTPCFTERSPVPPSEFCWFHTPPIWSPLDSECERIFLLPTVHDDLVNVNIDRKHRLNKFDDWRDWRKYRATDWLHNAIQWKRRKKWEKKRYWSKCHRSFQSGVKHTEKIILN